MTHPDNFSLELSKDDCSLDFDMVNFGIRQTLDMFYNMRDDVEFSTKYITQVVEDILPITQDCQTEQDKMCHAFLESVLDLLKNLEDDACRLFIMGFDQDIENSLPSKDWKSVKTGLRRINRLSQDVCNNFENYAIAIAEYETPALRNAWKEAVPYLDDVPLAIKSTLEEILGTFETFHEEFQPKVEYWRSHLDKLIGK